MKMQNVTLIVISVTDRRSITVSPYEASDKLYLLRNLHALHYFVTLQRQFHANL